MATADSQFEFLRDEWSMLFEPAAKAESLVNSDARSSCFHARWALELAVHWLYKHDAALKLPYQDHLNALIHAPSFRNAVGPAIFAKIKLVKDLGNLAVHSHKPVRQLDALTAAKELFHIARGAKPADGLCFNPDLLPKSSSVSPQTLEQLQKLESQLRERDEKLFQLLSGKKALDAELQRLRIEVAQAKQQNAARPDDIITRGNGVIIAIFKHSNYFINHLLHCLLPPIEIQGVAAAQSILLKNPLFTKSRDEENH